VRRARQPSSLTQIRGPCFSSIEPRNMDRPEAAADANRNRSCERACGLRGRDCNRPPSRTNNRTRETSGSSAKRLVLGEDHCRPSSLSLSLSCIVTTRFREETCRGIGNGIICISDASLFALSSSPILSDSFNTSDSRSISPNQKGFHPRARARAIFPLRWK